MSEIKFSDENCTDCGKPLKQTCVDKGFDECWSCRQIKRAYRKGDAASNTEVDAAVRHMQRKPGIFNMLFLNYFGSIH